MDKCISSYCVTHVGYKRDHNEDCYREVKEQGIWMVADGVGGHAAGEVASKIVVEEVAQSYKAGVPIVESLKLANQAVIDAPDDGRGDKGMGSTIVVLTISGDVYEIAWVGDSRAYRWDGVSLTQLTHDHTYVQGLVDCGVITKEDAIDHPLRNVLDQAIGMESNHIDVGNTAGHIKMGERFLLCSDGLSGEVPHSEIEEVFNKGLDDQVTIENLIDVALAHGGADNITAIVVSIRSVICTKNQ